MTSTGERVCAVGSGAGVVARGVAVTHRTPAGPVQALAPVSFEVMPGSSLAIMGPSGCGKSTLLGVLAGLARPTSGSVAIGGHTITGLDDRARVRFRRSRLGVVYQGDNLLPHLTVEENVGLQLAICRMGGGAPTANPTSTILDRLGIADLARRFPDQLSGGQRQRAAIARALVHRPAVVLADEPTGALDDDNAAAVVGLLVDAGRETGATLIVITHDQAVAGHLGRILRLARPVKDR